MIKNFFISGQRLKALSFALLLVSSLVCSLLSSPLANAASALDANYQNIDNISTFSNVGSFACANTDISSSWSSYITDSSKWSNPGSASDPTSEMSRARTSFQAALSSGRWGVSQHSEYVANSSRGTSGSFRVVQVFWTEDNSLALTWQTDGGIDVTGSGVHSISIGCGNVVFGNSSDNPVAWAYSGATRISNSTPFHATPTTNAEAYGIANFFVYTDHPNYPTGYGGIQIPSSFTPKADFYVPYNLNVDDKNITVTPKSVNTGGKCWKWAATLIKKGTSTSDNLADWEVISETDYLASNEPAHLRAKDYGTDYAIGMLAYDCDAPAPKISDSYNLKLERISPLKVDGSSYVLDSDNLNCDSGGVCEEPSPYENCSTYGTDLIGGLGCVMRNFGVFLRSLFVTLFVPTPGFLKDYFSSFKDFITTKLGFLVWPLQWAIDFINAFFNGLNGTNNICSWSFGNIFNSDFKLNFCSLEQNFPSVFNTARYMIQGLTVFVLISGLYTHYRRLIHT